MSIVRIVLGFSERSRRNANSAILQGRKTPSACKLFGTVCTPENPIGSCMVSSEGACAAHYTYGRFRDEVASPAS